MEDIAQPQLARRPQHVPELLVRDFDLYDPTEPGEDIHVAYARIQSSSPDIFWTPRNGGHWVVTSGQAVISVLRDPARFSNRDISLPPMAKGSAAMLPVELDPPHHAKYRQPLQINLHPSVVRKLEQTVRATAVQIIEVLVPLKGCEFIQDFARVLPIHIFLELVELPIADKDYLLDVVEDAVRARHADMRARARHKLEEYLLEAVRARRLRPGGDLLSKVVNLEVDDQKIPEHEALSYASLLLGGGLDTVASILGFIARFLAQSEAHRQELIDRISDTTFVDHAVDELIRRHSVSNIARVVAEDCPFLGVQLRAGDRLLPSNIFVGLDERLNTNALEVDFHRERPVHAAFGAGTHACPGAVLARREIRIFLEEWLPRIPQFRIKPGSPPVCAAGLVNSVSRLELVWP